MGTELQPNPLPDLTLFHLDAELQALVLYREERAADTADPITPEELAAIDGEITKYLEALPKKVSGVVAVIRDWKAKQEIARQECDRYAGIVRHFEAVEKRLKEYCAVILERQPMPAKGARKLTGADGSMIMLKGNGGLQPLEITDEAQLPDDCKKATITIPLNLWQDVFSAISDSMADEVSRNITVVIAPDQGAIRAVIQAEGGVPGARLLDRGSHVEIR